MKLYVNIFSLGKFLTCYSESQFLRKVLVHDDANMRIIRNNILPFRGFSAMNLFGILFVRKNARLSEKTLNHERIHTAQWRELWYVGFLLWYLIEWLARLPKGNAYRNISFEREAYANDDNFTYLETRKRFAFVKYMKT